MSRVAVPEAAANGTTDFAYDTDRSSGNGDWAFFGQDKAPEGISPFIGVEKRVLKNGTVCKGAKIELLLSPSLIPALFVRSATRVAGRGDDLIGEVNGETPALPGAIRQCG